MALALVSVALAPLVLAGTCIPTCEVVSAGQNGVGQAFVPALSVVESGSALVWMPTDGHGHTATGAGFCFNVNFGPIRTGSATFVIAEGALFAAEAGDDPETCDAATALPDGSFLLDYVCLLHPDMKARILVH